MTDDLHRTAEAAFARAARLSAEVESRYPDVWENCEEYRRNPDSPWPDWCLLPMAAAVYATSTPAGGFPDPSAPLAAVSALYAWHRTRSVWIVEPGLTDRLPAAGPEFGTLSAQQLPEWCVYLVEPGPDGTLAAGVFAHLEYDLNEKEPELRLLHDTDPRMDVHGLWSAAIPLDRPDYAEVVADYAAAARRERIGAVGTTVRGGEHSAGIAALADTLDGTLALTAYLSRPDAAVTDPDHPGRRPTRTERPTDTPPTIWTVGSGFTSGGSDPSR